MAIDKKDYPNKVKTNLYANKDYSVFYYDFTINAKRSRGLIDLSSKKGWGKKDKIEFAEAKLIAIKSTKRDSVFDDDVSLDKYMTKYFSLLQEGKWKNNQKSFYENHIKDFLGKKKLKDIRSIHIKELIKDVENKPSPRGGKLSVRSVKLVVEVLSPAFNEAINNRIIDFNPTATVKIKRPVTKKIVSNATAELKRINEAIYKVFENDLFYKALFLFAMQGRRRDEIVSLKWEDIDFDNNIYILRNTKNNEEQKIFLPNDVKEILLELKGRTSIYIFSTPIKDKPIQNIKNGVNKMRVVLNNPNFGLHYLRNVIVSAMAEQGLESIYLSGALGHNDPNTIKKYLTMNYLKSSEMASNVISGIVKKKD